MYSKLILATILGFMVGSVYPKIVYSAEPESTSKFFFEASAGNNWWVRGIYRTQDLNGRCSASWTATDGSSVLIVRDLADGESYMSFLNVDWTLAPESTGILRGNFHDGKEKFLKGWNFNYKVISKNVLVLPNMKHEIFAQIVEDQRFKYFRLVAPGNAANFIFPLANQKLGTLLLACIETSKNTKNPPLPDTPGKPLLKKGNDI